MNEVDKFWNKHIVGKSKMCKTKASLLRKISDRFDLYPGYYKLMGLGDDFSGKKILDYGCGPAWDLCWISTKGDRNTVLVGIDISEKALTYARHHLDLMDIYSPWWFDQIDDSFYGGEPLFGFFFDIIISSGVLHHVSDPHKVLIYLRSLMGKDSELRVMVYNKDSIFNKVYVPLMDGVFEHHVDGGKCPIARTYTQKEFIGLCRSVGLKAKFKGSYYDPRECPFIGKADKRLGGLGAVYYIKREN